MHSARAAVLLAFLLLFTPFAAADTEAGSSPESPVAGSAARVDSGLRGCQLTVGNCTDNGWCYLVLLGYCDGLCYLNVGSYCTGNCTFNVVGACLEGRCYVNIASSCDDYCDANVVGQCMVIFGPFASASAAVRFCALSDPTSHCSEEGNCFLNLARANCQAGECYVNVAASCQDHCYLNVAGGCYGDCFVNVGRLCRETCQVSVGVACEIGNSTTRAIG